MRLAVAATKMRGGFSCIQVRNSEKIIDWGVAASLGMLRLLSISSIQSTAGAMPSIVFRALRNAVSGLP